MGIVWLASYPKSGNTWVRAFLANLLANPETPIAVNRLPNYVYADHIGAHYEAVSDRPFASLNDGEINQLRPDVQRYIGRGQGTGKTVFCKTHAALTTIDEVPTIVPEVTEGAVYVVRNPLDVCVSYADHYGMTIDRASQALCASSNRITTEAETAFQLLGSWSDHVRSWLAPPGLRRHVLRYEDMIADPHAAFAGLVGFLGLPEDLDRLKKAIAFSRFDTLRRSEQADGFVERSPHSKRFFRSGKSGGWRRKLGHAQVERLIQTNGQVMAQFGYLDKAGKPR